MKKVWILLGLVTSMLVACGPIATPGPTPDLQPTVEALVNQRVAKMQQDAMNAKAKSIIAEMLAATPTPLPTPTATPTKTPTPVPPPTPTQPAQGKTYRNSEYGYSISVAPGWTVDEAVQSHILIFRPGAVAVLEVATAVAPEFNGDELFDRFTDAAIELHRSQSSGSFELLSRTRVILPSGLVAARIAFLSQEQPGVCVGHFTDVLIFVKPNLYALKSGVCKEDTVLYQATIEAMQNSFAAFTPTSKVPTPTATPRPSPTTTPPPTPIRDVGRFTQGEAIALVKNSLLQTKCIVVYQNGQLGNRSGLAEWQERYGGRGVWTVSAKAGGYPLEWRVYENTLVVEVVKTIQWALDPYRHC